MPRIQLVRNALGSPRHRDWRANRFDLHAIVRRYAYGRPATRDLVGAHTRLLAYRGP